MYEFISSHGTLIVNEDGTINKTHPNSDLNGWLKDIEIVDVEELKNYYLLSGLLSEIEDGDLSGDVLDFGYWDNKGVYQTPDLSWRETTFHRQDLQKKEIKEIIHKATQWLSINRQF